MEMYIVEFTNESIKDKVEVVVRSSDMIEAYNLARSKFITLTNSYDWMITKIKYIERNDT